MWARLEAPSFLVPPGCCFLAASPSRQMHKPASLPRQPLPQVHAEGEAEHAAIGHEAVVSFVPAEQEAVLRRAIQDHDRDMAAFYNHLADLMA